MNIKDFPSPEGAIIVADQRRYFVPCPHCGHMQWLEFERLRFDKGRSDTAHNQCIACNGHIEEHHKTVMPHKGEWRATGEGSDPGTIGFHFSALYSPVGWFSWADIARMWEAVQAANEAKRSFKNGVLGLSWIESSEAPDWQRLYARAAVWIAGADRWTETMWRNNRSASRQKKVRTSLYRLQRLRFCNSSNSEQQFAAIHCNAT